MTDKRVIKFKRRKYPDIDFNPSDPKEYHKIHNLVIEILCEFDLSGREHKLFWAIVRKTWGWNKAWEEIRWKYFVGKTGITSNNVGAIITRLKKRKILQVKPGKRWQKYKINSKLSQWLTLDEIKQTTLKNESTLKNDSGALSNSRAVPLSNSRVIPLKDNIKKTLSLNKEKECVLPKGFNLSLESEKYALNKGIDIKKIDDFFDAFCNWVEAKGIKAVDWEAEFRLYCDRAPQFGRQYLTEQARKGK